MSKDLFYFGDPHVCWNSDKTQILDYTIQVSHRGLNEQKNISAPSLDILELKVKYQFYMEWYDKWEEVKSSQIKDYENTFDLEDMTLFKEGDVVSYFIDNLMLQLPSIDGTIDCNVLFKNIDGREGKDLLKAALIEIVNSRTLEAKQALNRIDNLLLQTSSVNDTVDWESLKKRDKFTEQPPLKPSPTQKLEYPSKPDKQCAEFTPWLTVWERIIKSKRARKIQEYEDKHTKAVSEWEEKKAEIEKQNNELDAAFKDELKKYESQLSEWEHGKREFLDEQTTFNNNIDRLKKLYWKQDAESVVVYCKMVLNNSEYPDSFPKNFELEYNSDSKILIIEYELPSLECFPKIQEVKYIASKNEIKEVHLPESKLKKMFDDAIYKITLRTMHEIFEADAANAIDAISFNGRINAINKATGNNETNCVLTIQAKKDEFSKINLSKVDPKTCFKSLKGIAASKLSSLTSVQPILQISRLDKRIVEGYAVANQIDNSTNIAVMDWQDFENLIREIFEKEFAVSGGEVKITQASRDGGVDAIAFDPDPIRGGKIVIQAKRYTNTVGVSAVRDLYGTLINEGATKGILVSTADYGPDAYEFAKGKPITLLNGSNLLYILERHGHHAKIDLREAKKILNERDKSL